ncbi:MAG: hypothetical protein JWL71_5036 [Acidobacteria bacterium]|nr:hypothetical protein [Acidobacteriota bacterium]
MQPHGRTTVLLFVLFQALYALTSSGNAFRVPDEFEVYFQVEHLVDAGDLSVPQTLAIRQPRIVNGQVVGSQPIFYGKFGVDHRPYAPYGPFAAFLALPHHLAARAIAWIAGVPRAPLPGGLPWVFLVGGLTTLFTATGAALAVAGFHRAALALGAPPGTALVLSLLLGGATVLWVYGVSFYCEGWQAAMLIWAAALLIEARAGSAADPARIAGAAALLMLVGLTKVTGMVFTPAFVLAVLAERMVPARSRLQVAIALSAGIAAAVAIHLTWNAYRFGLPFDFGYDASETVTHMPPQLFRLADVPRGLVMSLVTPGKGLIVWAPALLLAATSLRDFWRRQPAVALGVVVAGVTGLLFFAAYLFPEAGYSHGPRTLVPIVPLLLLPAVARPIEQRSRAAVAACAIAGFTIALLATSVSFLEDQGIGGDLGRGAALAYYERIDPPPGRAWNRYRLAYVPFVRTLSAGQWPSGDAVGHGLDYLPHHLARARRELPGGAAIPLWLVWAMPMFWLAMLAAAAAALQRESRVDSADLQVRRAGHA